MHKRGNKISFNHIKKPFEINTSTIGTMEQNYNGEDPERISRPILIIFMLGKL